MKIRPSSSFSFIFLLWNGVAGDDVKCQAAPVRLGQPASLVCKFGDSSAVTQSTWTRCDPSSNIVVFNPTHGTHIADDYKERVKIQEYHTLTLTRVEEEDFGLYCCNIVTYPRGSLDGRVHLLRAPEEDQSPRSGLPMVMIYISCGVAGLIILVGIITALVCTQRKTKIRNPVHVTLRSSSVNLHQASVLQKDPHIAQEEEEEDEEEEDGGMYLNVKSSQ